MGKIRRFRIREKHVMNSLKAEEDEKSAFSGRKSRKERRILKEKRLAGRIPSPPSYATYDQGYVICILGSLLSMQQHFDGKLFSNLALVCCKNKLFPED